MGIHNFWAVVESSGRTISIETLRGKRLAVDISIWLNQIVRASRTKTGDVVPNAHIYIVILRLCKLLYYGIKPVIIFDGDAPALKKITLKRRREKADQAKRKMDEVRDEMDLVDMASRVKNPVCKEVGIHGRVSLLFLKLLRHLRTTQKMLSVTKRKNP